MKCKVYVWQPDGQLFNNFGRKPMENPFVKEAFLQISATAWKTVQQG